VFKALIYLAFCPTLASCQQSYPQKFWIVFKTYVNQALRRLYEVFCEYRHATRVLTWRIFYPSWLQRLRTAVSLARWFT
jgi:hypothetical protein